MSLGLRGLHGGAQPFHQKSPCLTRLTAGPYVVQIWSRNNPESGVNKTYVLHRVNTFRIQDLGFEVGFRIGGLGFEARTKPRRSGVALEVRPQGLQLSIQEQLL